MILKRKIKKILIFFFIIIFLEIFFQLFYFFSNQSFIYKRIDLPIYNKTTTGCWKVKPNLKYLHSTDEFNYSIITNKNSFRIKEKESINPIKPDSKLVMFLGGYLSFGKGINYENSYAYLISQYLKIKKFNSLNASIPAQLPNRQLCWFLNKGYKYEPDLLIQTVNNSFELNFPASSEKLINFCKNLDKCNIHNYTVKGSRLEKNTKTNFFKKFFKYSGIVFYSWKSFIYYKVNFYKQPKPNLNKITKINFEKYEFFFQNYIKFVKDKSPKTRVIFLYIPNSYLIHEKDFYRYINKDFKEYEEELFFKINLSKYLNNKFNFINTYYDLKSYNKKRLYNLIDTSLTEDGNNIVFKSFYRYCENIMSYN